MNKKSIARNISLGTICLLGLGGFVGVFTISNNNAVEAHAISQDDGGVYQIASASDLEYFRDSVVNNGHPNANAVLTADITLSNSWSSPIGTSTAPYTGTFDGKKHTISSLSATTHSISTTSTSFGLFGTVRGGTVKGIRLARGYFDVSDEINIQYLGGIAGRLTDGGTISDCHLFRTDIFNGYNPGYAGGIVGELSGGSSTIANCSNVGYVEDYTTGIGGYDYIGGLAGLSDGKIINCFNDCILYIPGEYSSYAGRQLLNGGIAGKLGENSSTVSCHNYGDLNVFNASGVKVGGLAGSVEGTATAQHFFYCNEKQSSWSQSYGDVTNFAQGLTKNQFKDKKNVENNFPGWNFSSDWRMGSDYPVLRALDVIYTINLDKEEGSSGSSAIYELKDSGFYNDIQCSDDNLMTTTDNSISLPSKTGYLFRGYYTEPNGEGTQYIDRNGYITASADSSHFTANGTLYAKWTANTYNVTYKDQGNVDYTGDAIDSSYNAYTYGTGLTLPTGTKTGYTFGGWFVNSDCSGDAVTTITTSDLGDKTFYAKWTANKYTAIFDFSPGTGGLASILEEYNATVSDLNEDQLPTGPTVSGKTYAFGGYYSKPSTLNGDGTYSHDGTLFYDANGVGQAIWNIAGGAYLYAYYTLGMTGPSSTIEYAWEEGTSRTISPSEMEFYAQGESTTPLTGVEVRFFDSTTSDYTLEVAPSFSDIGSHDIKYKASRDGYTTLYETVTIQINKASSEYTSLPTIKDQDFVYTGEAQSVLDNAGSASGDNKMMYAVTPNTVTEVPDDSSFSEDLPTITDIGSYYIFYKTSGDDHYNPIPASFSNKLEVTMSEVDKTALQASIDAADNYSNTINDYPSIKTDLESAIDEATNNYLNKPNVTETEVANAVTALNNAVSEAKVSVTEALINVIGDIDSDGFEGRLQKALDYYNDVLSNDEKAMVDSALAAELINKNAANEVIELIKAIPEASDSDEYYTAVDNANTAYNQLTSDQKLIISNTAYQKTLDDNLAAKAVIQSIDDIGDVVYGGDNDSNAKITASENAYAALTSDQKALVINYDTLVADRTLYDHVDAVADLIEAIPTSSATDTYYDAVSDAKTKFDTLTDEEKTVLGEAYTKTLDDNLAAKEVIILIQDIGDVIYGGDNDSNAKITSAENAYAALTDDQKALVCNYDTLTSDRTIYDHVDAAIDLVNAIPTAADVESYYDAVDAAKTQYDTLTSDEKTIFTATEYQTKLDDNVAAKAVIEQIHDIGDVIYNAGQDDSKDVIDACLTAYDALTDDQKALVNGANYDEMTEAKTIYDNAAQVASLIDAIPEASESKDYYDAVDKAYDAYNAMSEEELKAIQGATIKDYEKLLLGNVPIKEVIVLIQDIGKLSYDGGKNDSQKDILTAYTAYGKLTDEQKESVNEVNYNTLKHDLEVYAHVDAAGDAIKAIPEASVSDEYYEAVDYAKAKYDALTEEELELLNESFDFDYEKTLEDALAAKEVVETINEIGEVTYNGGNNDSKADIENAEVLYDALTDDQKAIVDNANHDELVDNRETYDNVDETVKLIDDIKDINYGGSSDSKEGLETARKAYDSLTEEQKALVNKYNDSYQTLEDGEKTYEVLELIDEIGTVEYDTETGERIMAARRVYDSLSQKQKSKVSKDLLETLENAESEYASKKDTSNILVIILIVVSSVALLGGIIFLIFLLLKRRSNDDDNDNSKGRKEPVKAMSIGGVIPFIVLSSLYADGPFIVLYIIASLAVIVWIICLVVVLSNKKHKKAKEATFDSENAAKQKENVEETKPVEPVKEKTIVEKIETNDEEEEVETVTDERGNIFQIRFVKSFTAKLIQAPIETKKYYEELKNEVLSYKKTNTRISWHYDSINSGRNQVLKFVIRGKTLCLYYPLNADDYSESKYKVEKVESKKYEEVPCLYRIKNDRRLRYAKELIAEVASRLSLIKVEEQHEVYVNLPYEDNKPLIARGLIKELKVQVNKPSETIKVNDEGDEIVTTKDDRGNVFQIRYIKSFAAKLSQSDDEVKDYYNELKNYVLSYKKANSRLSWHYDAINVGRNQVLKFTIRGKTLCLYYALDADQYIDSKYKVEKVESKKYEDTPCLYRIKNDRRRDYAKDLIDTVMNNVPTELGKESNEDFKIPYETTKILLEKGLIKELKVQVNNPEPAHESISANDVDQKMSDEIAESKIEEDLTSKKHEGKKGIINIDTIGDNFNDGDVVDIEALWKKKLLPSNVGYVKVLARGSLDKRLTLNLQDYSIQAVKMILLAGGKVKKAK